MHTILTDIGGVVLLPNAQLWDELKRRGAPDDVEQIFYGDEGPWERTRTGHISHCQYVGLAAQMAGLDRQWVAELLESMQWTVNEPMVDWLRNNRLNGLKIVAVSNADTTLETHLAKHQILNLFDRVVNSARVGCAKPDHEIYQAALRLAGVQPEDCLFIDDRELNILPARQLGMRAVVYAGHQQFLDDVRALGE